MRHKTKGEKADPGGSLDPGSAFYPLGFRIGRPGHTIDHVVQNHFYHFKNQTDHYTAHLKQRRVGIF
jgi:hypothetical protein